MKRIIYILLMLPLFAQGQAVVNWKKAAYTGSMKFGAGLLGYANATLAQQDSNSFAESCAWLELGNDTTTRGFLMPRVLRRDSVTSPKKGLLVFEHVSGLVLAYDGSAWDTLSGGSGGGASVTDSMIFATRYWVGQNFQPIGTYLTPSDTAAMLTPYLREIDTTGKWWSQSVVFIRPSDTASMLSTYLRKIDTTNKWLPVGTTFVASETDPVFTASDAFSVTSTLIGQWNAAYNDKVNSLAFSGTGTKTLTLTQQDAGTVTNTFTDLGADTTNYWATKTNLSSAYVPYTGASSAVDLGINNLTTTGRVSGSTLRLTNPTSYGDYTSAATVPRSYISPDADITVAGIAQTITNGVTATAPSEDAVFDALALKFDNPTGTATNGYFLRSASGVPTWQSYAPTLQNILSNGASASTSITLTGSAGLILDNTGSFGGKVTFAPPSVSTITLTAPNTGGTIATTGDLAAYQTLTGLTYTQATGSTNGSTTNINLISPGNTKTFGVRVIYQGRSTGNKVAGGQIVAFGSTDGSGNVTIVGQTASPALVTNLSGTTTAVLSASTTLLRLAVTSDFGEPQVDWTAKVEYWIMP